MFVGDGVLDAGQAAELVLRSAAVWAGMACVRRPKVEVVISQLPGTSPVSYGYRRIDAHSRARD
jgi:hypothetical protein